VSYAARVAWTVCGLLVLTVVLTLGLLYVVAPPDRPHPVEPPTTALDHLP
jgi:hypothetical protein